MIKLILSAVFLLISSTSLSCKVPVQNSKEENFKNSVQHLSSEQLAATETILLFSKNKRNSISRFLVFTDYKTADSFLLTLDFQKLIFLKE
jgi:hypothetical protein